MRRRDFIRGIIGSATAFPLAVEAQQAERVRRIGVMMGYAETDPAAQAQVAALRQELQIHRAGNGREMDQPAWRR